MADQGQYVEGTGIAGTPNGGVLTVQGPGAGGGIVVSGTVAATQSGAWSVDAVQSGAWSVDTELPAAVALSDALANPTTPMVGSALLGWDSTNSDWDRIRSVGDDVAFAAGGPFGRLPVRSTPYVWDSLFSVWRQWSADHNGVPWVAEKHVSSVITVAGGANAIATATLPAAGAGRYHYITHLSIRRVATAALAGGALLTVTTTNLGGRSWRTDNQASITVSTFSPAVLIDQEYAHPLRSDVANTNTTITCPAAGAAVSWHIVVDYYIAA